MSNLYARAAMAEQELIARGVPDGTARAAVSHALRWSESIAAKVSPDLQDRVANDLFTAALTKSDRYVQSMVEAFDLDASAT